jgi:molecular chaperone GrpE
MGNNMGEHRDRNGQALPRFEEAANGSDVAAPAETRSHGELPFRQAVQARQEDTAARIERLLRALAEAENARKRAERMAGEARQYAIGDFARDLLAVADNLDRAVAAAAARGSPGDESTILDGVRATRRMLHSLIERYGVKKIESLGAYFDPKIHEAVMVVENDAEEPGVIVEVAEDGYMLHDRLLRPARVFVNNPNRPAMNLRGEEPG